MSAQGTDAVDEAQLAALVDNLRSEDAQQRTHAMENLPRIAEALGAERTRAELVPFIAESTDDDDEVLIVLAEKIGELVDLLGGTDAVHELLPPLELLASVEESSVRDKSVTSATAVFERIPDAELAQHYEPFVRSLAAKDWFTARVSAAALCHVCEGRLSEQLMRELMEVFKRLCTDDTPMVRRVAVQNLGKVAEALRAAPSLLPAFERLRQDDHDSVRVQAIASLVPLARQLPDSTSELLSALEELCLDRSWRVRWTAAQHFSEAITALGVGTEAPRLARLFVGLMQDTEAEVRTSAAGVMVGVARQVLPGGGAAAQEVVAAAQRLASDPSDHVRASLASSVNELAPVLGQEDTVQQLLPMLLQLLRDESSDVRLNVISTLGTINDVIGVELLSQSLLPAIVDLAEDGQWRVRLAIIEHVPMLAAQLGVNFFNERLNNLCMTWLGDDVFSIRVAAATNLRQLSEHFGEEWAKAHVLGRVDRMHTHANYLQRMTSLYAMQALVKCLSAETVKSSLLPMALEMTRDSVPNVRFTVAKTLGALMEKLPLEVVRQTVAPALNQLNTDSDRDVRFYATRSMQALP